MNLCAWSRFRVSGAARDSLEVITVKTGDTEPKWLMGALRAAGVFKDGEAL